MARELDINIKVNDDGAKQTLDGVDQAFDQTAASAQKMGTAVEGVEAKLAAAKRELIEIRAAATQFGGTASVMAQWQEQIGTAEAKVSQLEKSMGNTASTMQDKVTPAAKEAGSAMDGMDRIATRLVERMAILFALKGTFQFVEGIFQAAAKTDALAVSLDTTSEKVQELEFASRQTLVPIGSLTGAMDTLGKKLIGGSGSTVDAIEGLGLSFDRLWQLNPSERFDVVSNAIASMGDKTQRAGFEIALFGTDKIDPVISKLNELEKQAHQSGQVMGDETVKQLAEADKAFKNTQVQLEILAAKWLVAAQNAVAYHLAATSGGRAIAGGVETGFDANGRLVPMQNLPPEEQERQRQKTIDAQIAAMTAGLQAPGKATGAGLTVGGLQSSLGMNPSDPGTKEGLAELAAAERVITMEVREQMKAEQEQLAFEKMAYNERQTIFRKIQEEMKKTSEMWLKVTNDQVIAELNARAAVNAAHGLDASGVPDAFKQDPLTKAQTALDELHKKKQPGISQEFQEQQIQEDFQKAVAEGTEAVVGMTAAEREAAKSASTMSQAHAGAVVASDSLSSAFGRASGVFMQTVTSHEKTAQSSVQRTLAGGQYSEGEAAAIAAGQFIAGVGIQKFAEGGPIRKDGPIYAHAGEFVVPKGGMLVKSSDAGGGVSIGDIHVHGNVESESSARLLADRVARIALERLQFKTPLTKTK